MACGCAALPVTVFLLRCCGGDGVPLSFGSGGPLPAHLGPRGGASKCSGTWRVRAEVPRVSSNGSDADRCRTGSYLGGWGALSRSRLWSMPRRSGGTCWSSDRRRRPLIVLTRPPARGGGYAEHGALPPLRSSKCVLGVGGGGLPGRRGRVKTLTRPGQPGRATAGILRARGVGVLPVRGGGPAGGGDCCPPPWSGPGVPRALGAGLWRAGVGSCGPGRLWRCLVCRCPAVVGRGSSTGGRLPGRGRAHTPWGRAAALRDGQGHGWRCAALPQLRQQQQQQQERQQQREPQRQQQQQQQQRRSSHGDSCNREGASIARRAWRLLSQRRQLQP